MITNDTLEKMQRRGGGFAKAIAAAYYVADSQNRAKLEAAFADLFAQYK
tara:strand:- start:279 stop:425 length:147 start_codon:yes stop_codon:yes gene_type:complete